jgi:hypothetical protein
MSARDAEQKKLQRQQLTEQERNALEELKHQGIHPTINATFDVPMGYVAEGIENDMYNTPPDLLHAFLCGLMKNVLLWTVSIVLTLSAKDRLYKQSKGVLDGRVGSFKHLASLPNVTSKYFKTGLTFISGNKSNKGKSSETGGAAGFRSVEFVMALFQVYFAIGFNGSVLPAEDNFEFQGAIVGESCTYRIIL